MLRKWRLRQKKWFSFLKNVHIEAAAGGALCKKEFLKISQNSQENTCAILFYFLIKLQV